MIQTRGQNDHPVVSEFSSEKNEIEQESEQSSDNDFTIDQNLEAALPNSVSEFGDINVRNSKKVRFGNQTIIKGPVTFNNFEGQSRSRNFREIESLPKNVLDNNLENYNKNDTLGFGASLLPEVNINSKWWTKKKIAATLFGVFFLLALISAVIIITEFSFENKKDGQKVTSTPATTTTTDKITDSTEDSTTDLSSTSKSTTPGDYDLPMVSRCEWGAVEYNYTRIKLDNPEYVIVCHAGVTIDCFNKTDCITKVNKLQHWESEYYEDIRYNFLVGGDGNIYEGRGWDIAGDHTYNFSKISLGIAMLGSFNQENVTMNQLKTLKKLVNYSCANNKVSKEYKLTARGQIHGADDPGYNITRVIRNWPHWTEKP